MAEVTITMVDPEAYEGPVAVEPEVVVEHEGPARLGRDEVRRRRAAEAEEIIANEQPGQVIEEDESGESQSTGESQATAEGPQAVVLKIRRRRFQRTPQKGESSSPAASSAPAKASTCSTASFAASATSRTSSWAPGLGPRATPSLARSALGQLLSSKPHDRRAIIEEAAGITRFKTKKRLAELRLESARQNLARVDDIFEEVTRQMNSLKRQAAKAERFASCATSCADACA